MSESTAVVRVPCIIESPFKASDDLLYRLQSAKDLATRMLSVGMHPERVAWRKYSEVREELDRTVESNARYLRALARYAFDRGYAPWASHALYTQWLDDNIPAERELGIEAGLCLANALEGSAGNFPLRVFVGVDLGISEGMRIGIERHQKMGRPIIEVSLDGWRK